jgi:hypothetical protein
VEPPPVLKKTSDRHRLVAGDNQLLQSLAAHQPQGPSTRNDSDGLAGHDTPIAFIRALRRMHRKRRETLFIAQSGSAVQRVIGALRLSRI